MLTLAAVIVLAGASWSPSPASAEVRSYELRIEGPGCLFRVFGLERELAHLDGVRRVEIDPTTGSVKMTLEPEATLMPDALIEAVEDAGLRVGEVSAVARGTVRGSAEGGRLAVGGSRALVLLAGPGTEKLHGIVGEGRRSVELRGELRRHGDGWGMAVGTVTEPEVEEGEEE